jgi:hypothetical protein
VPGHLSVAGARPSRAPRPVQPLSELVESGGAVRGDGGNKSARVQTSALDDPIFRSSAAAATLIMEP